MSIWSQGPLGEPFPKVEVRPLGEPFPKVEVCPLGEAFPKPPPHTYTRTQLQTCPPFCIFIPV